MRALARVNGMSGGLLGDFSEDADSEVGPAGIEGKPSWGALARDVVIAGDKRSVFGTGGDLNHSSVTNCI